VLAAVLLLRDPSPGTVVPARDPAPALVTPSGLTGAGTFGPPPTGSASDSAGSGGPAGSGDVLGAGSGVASGAVQAEQFRVYVVGQVRRPGVVTLAMGARVEDAVEAVGGATAKADLAVMNLARKVVDGERIVVPRPGEKVATSDPVADAGSAGAAPAAGGTGAAGPGTPVDLNTATVAQLDALPGVGPVIAGRIIAWRQENGRFVHVDDLAEVQGIGDAILARLRPLVRV
jgi:competence protein ComEA